MSSVLNYFTFIYCKFAWLKRPIDNKWKVDIKNVYQYDEIVKIAKEFRQNPSFEKVSENIKKISSRVINNIKVKPVHKKSKDNFKSKPDWRENEEIEIISSFSWRKPRTDEEEKIAEKAKRYKAKLTGSKEEHENIKRSIKATLNKLSPTNIEKLEKQLLDIGKVSTNNLIFLVQCIFEKAWSEKKYTQTYADLCKYLKEGFENYIFSEEQINIATNKKQNLFKSMLLDHCENSFTSAPSEDFSGLSEEEKEARSALIKTKTLGNVRFIGELFKVELITSRVVLHCVNELINKENLDENKLEGACILLSTGGSKFERSKILKETNKIFKELEVIIKNQNLSSKMKFKIMDLFDDRNNQWKKNFKEEVKTVQEIHQEFELELQKKRGF